MQSSRIPRAAQTGTGTHSPHPAPAPLFQIVPLQLSVVLTGTGGLQEQCYWRGHGMQCLHWVEGTCITKAQKPPLCHLLGEPECAREEGGGHPLQHTVTLRMGTVLCGQSGLTP